jgi:hypothetical protein
VRSAAKLRCVPADVSGRFLDPACRATRVEAYWIITGACNVENNLAPGRRFRDGPGGATMFRLSLYPLSHPPGLLVDSHQGAPAEYFDRLNILRFGDRKSFHELLPFLVDWQICLINILPNRLFVLKENVQISFVQKARNFRHTVFSVLFHQLWPDIVMQPSVFIHAFLFQFSDPEDSFHSAS